MTYQTDLEKAGVPSFNLGACRNADYESETLDFHQLDLTGAGLECYIGEHPDADVRLATLIASKHVETKPYQDFIDECRFEEGWIPCGETASDMMTTSIITISSAKTAFTHLPRASTKGESVSLYYVLRQTTPPEQVLLAGKFYLTETA